MLSEIPSDKTLADVYKWNENLRQDLEETTDEFNNTLNDKDKVINDLNSTKKQLETDQWELTAAKRQVDLLLWQLETKEKELSESLTENQRLESGKFNLKRELKNQKREQETINKKLREDLQNNLNILANKEKVIEVFKVNFEKTKEHFQGIIDRNSKDFNVISTKNNRAKEGLKSTLKKKTEAYKKIISERDRQINHLHNTIFERVTERDARPNITHTYYNNLVNERNNLATERNDWQKKWNEESTNHQETQQKLTESAVANSQLKTDLAQVQSDFQQEQNDHQQTQGKLTILVEQHNNCPRKHRKEITEEINQELELNFAENELTFEQVIRRIKELIRNPINDKETLQTQLAEAQAMVTQLQVQLAEKKPDDASVPLELINSIKEDAFQLCQALKISLSPETREKMEKETQHEKLISLRDELIKNHLAQQSNLTAIGTEKSPQRQDEWLIPLILISNLIITWLTIFYLVRRQRLRNK